CACRGRPRRTAHTSACSSYSGDSASTRTSGNEADISDLLRGNAPFCQSRHDRPLKTRFRPPRLSTAHAETAHIHMEVVVMRSVIFRAQGYPEDLACGCLDLSQKSRLVVIPFPVPGYGDPCAVLQMKAGQVQCIGRGMLTASIAAGNVAAGEAAEVVDSYYRLAEHPLGCRLQAVTLKQRIGCRQWAGGERGTIEPHLGTVDPHCIFHRATRLWRAVGYRNIGQVRGRQCLLAEGAILLQAT